MLFTQSFFVSSNSQSNFNSKLSAFNSFTLGFACLLALLSSQVSANAIPHDLSLALGANVGVSPAGVSADVKADGALTHDGAPLAAVDVDCDLDLNLIKRSDENEAQESSAPEPEPSNPTETSVETSTSEPTSFLTLATSAPVSTDASAEAPSTPTNTETFPASTVQASQPSSTNTQPPQTMTAGSSTSTTFDKNCSNACDSIAFRMLSQSGACSNLVNKDDYNLCLCKNSNVWNWKKTCVRTMCNTWTAEDMIGMFENACRATGFDLN